MCMCVSLGGCCWGAGCLWDLPLSVIEKCDLENVCPAEHESYLHSNGGVLRGSSPGPWQGEPRIGWELTLRATLSLHHTQKKNYYLIVLKNPRLTKNAKKIKKILQSMPISCEKTDLNKGTRCVLKWKCVCNSKHIYFIEENKIFKTHSNICIGNHDLPSSGLKGLVKSSREHSCVSAYLTVIKVVVIKCNQKLSLHPAHSGSSESFSLTHNHYFKYRMHLHTVIDMKTHERGHGTSAMDRLNEYIEV